MSSENENSEALIAAATELADSWLRHAKSNATSQDLERSEQMAGLIATEESVAFVMRFVDQIARTESNAVAAHLLRQLVASQSLPSFLGAKDKLLLKTGALFGPILPRLVIPLARRRLRSLVGHLVAPADVSQLSEHLAGYNINSSTLNINLLGETVLGEAEAGRRLDNLLKLIEVPEVDYVSVKISAVASQLNYWDHDRSLKRISERLHKLVVHANSQSKDTFINFDMEEYSDLDLTVQAFKQVLEQDSLRTADAGIVLQTYLPDAWNVLTDLVSWANKRHDSNGGEIKIRLVKGANLAMERVDAALHGWPQAPYASKHETDANFKRCVDWALTADRLRGVRIGLASHNLFDVAWTHLLAEKRNVSDRVQFEMLLGMAQPQARAVRETSGSMLLYTPAVEDTEFDVAISYLFRRLEENSSEENFLRHVFNLEIGSPSYLAQRERFAASTRARHQVSSTPRRTQNRLTHQAPTYHPGEPFLNEPDTDPSLKPNQQWIRETEDAVKSVDHTATSELTNSSGQIDRVYDQLRQGQISWQTSSAEAKQQVLHNCAAELAKRRKALIAAMVSEANKTFAEADSEVSEAIDFARWYGDQAVALQHLSSTGCNFDPFGTVAVVPPWNFPVAIPAGGVFACLASGNSVLLKPATETPRCAELVVQACHAAGVSTQVLTLVRTPDNETGRHLVCSADAVILTGAFETARKFLSWKPDMRLFAETSGKNALIITQSADIDLAVADLVTSAFGHAGQKCSAASLAILVGGVAKSERFKRQLADAVSSLQVGPTHDPGTTIGPLISEPNPRLRRAFEQLDAKESWLVKPRNNALAKNLWSPGVKDNVELGNWFQQTECFGPVLGLVNAKDLDDAIAIQNSSSYGLTGGIHSLDSAEVDKWLDAVQVGNAYVNRAITGAIVGRQPFGGWKRSSIGAGTKAGGPNYLLQLGVWSCPTQAASVQANDYDETSNTYFSQIHDPVGLFCEDNQLRYKPLDLVLIRQGQDGDQIELELAIAAAKACGTQFVVATAAESDAELALRLEGIAPERIRYVGSGPRPQLQSQANELDIHIQTGQVLKFGRVELLNYLKEQTISRTRHRFGNLV